MTKHERFNIKDLSDLKARIKKLGLDLPIQEDTSILFSPLPLNNGRTLTNRFVVHPMEGLDSNPDGAPGDLTFRRYYRYAAGGPGLIWFEACSIVPEARSNPCELYITADNVEKFKDLASVTRQAAKKSYDPNINPLLILQLTHSGRYSKPNGKPEPIIAHHSPMLDPLHELPEDFPLVTDEYLDMLQDRFVDAAKLAAQAGFDGVDIKSCHRYLISELLASHTRENSKYGGSFENRSRFLREVIHRVKNEVEEIFVTTRLNLFDAIPYPYGFGMDENGQIEPDLKEPLWLVNEIKKTRPPIINQSIGDLHYEPHFGRAYDKRVFGKQIPKFNPLENVAKFINITRIIQQMNPELPVIGAGFSWLRQFIPHAAAGCIDKKWISLIGLGRSSFAYPDSISDLKLIGSFDKMKTCVACSGCSELLIQQQPTGCIIRDNEIYKKQEK